ncbi:FHA domain-containing protein [Pseudoalteromonas denitrificans]|uniref:FHA domain protein n=1 Tax=Pseudoalteromonas denitrificans DSM 6059 TaxID=1123010 RepID=A0A1I1U3J8_9GAMM|nr:FHA domain-containing protein [Pseudoalteromonas denitrificans]SFD63283.1 FHA domain protein [Pseudoalteromonas denitrificans DSM 6059]
MAHMINNLTHESVTLLMQHIFGRHPSTSHTVLINPDASRMHATILWDGEDWLLQDSSTNGSFVNGKQVLRGTKHRLYKGDLIHFSNLSGGTWELLDVLPPKSLLIPLTPGLETVELERLAVLPDENSPEITLYLSPNGHWVCESQSGISVLKTGDLVGASDKTWRFIEARASNETVRLESIELPNSAQIGIYFDVSQNEEHVSVKFNMNGCEYDLGLRNHHYLLLLLARKRIEDKAAGLTESEQGWIDKEHLSKMLGLNESHINIQVYRFRKQIIKALPKSLCLPQAIERRTREIRFAYNNVEIAGGAQFTLASNKVI